MPGVGGVWCNRHLENPSHSGSELTFSCSDGALGSTKEKLAPPVSIATRASVTEAAPSAGTAVTAATGALLSSPTTRIPEAPARGNCLQLELGGAEGAGNGCPGVLHSRSSKYTPL